MPFRASFAGGRSGGLSEWSGIALNSSQYIHGGAGAFNQNLKRIIVRGTRDSLPPNGNGVFAGTTEYGTTGWGILAAAFPGQPAADRGRMHAYTNAVSSTYLHVPNVIDTRMHTWEIWQDTVSGRTRFFEDGLEQGNGVASAVTTLGIPTLLSVNRRANALTTLPWGSLTIVEIQTSITEPTRAEILANAAAAPGRQVAGSQRLFLVPSAATGAVGSAWVDSLAGTSLTVVGSPNYRKVTVPKIGFGTLECYGDSIVAGRNQAGTVDGGWRLPMVQAVNAAERSICLVGQFTVTVLIGDSPTSYQFDMRTTAAGGQALGVNNGSAPKLDTLAADVVNATTGAPDSHTYLGYGVNDIAYRVVTLGQTPTDAANALLADVATAVGIIRAARTGWIFVQDVLRLGTGASGSTVNSRQSIDTYNSLLPALIDSLNTLHGKVKLVPACAAITGSQSIADDTNVLYDGTHPTPATKVIMGRDVIAPVILSTF